MHKYFSVFFLMAGLLLIESSTFALDSSSAISAQREELDEVVAPATKKFKGTLSTYYYDFHGTRAANNNLYSFGDMSFQLELATLEYQINPNWTLMVMGQFVDNISEINIFGGKFKDRTTGLGDTLVSITRTVFAGDHFLLLADGGVSIPTGSIRERNKYVPKLNYIYPLQLGSGTFDAALGLTPIWTYGKVQWGSRLSSSVRTYDNSLGYHLGNQYKADGWADYNFASGFTPRLLASYCWKDPVHGADPTLPRGRLTEVFYHPQVTWNFSAALKYQKTIRDIVTITGEFGVPFLQDSQNSDNMVIQTRYYGYLTLNTAF